MSNVSLDEVVSAIRHMRRDEFIIQFMNVWSGILYFGQPHLQEKDVLSAKVPAETARAYEKIADWLCGDVLETMEIPAEGGGLKRIYFVQPEAIAAMNEIGVRFIVEYRTNMSGQPDLYIQLGQFIIG